MPLSSVAIRGVEKRPKTMEARMPCIGKTVITSETDAGRTEWDASSGVANALLAHPKSVFPHAIFVIIGSHTGRGREPSSVRVARD
jgi:hypothetical protein